MKSFGVSTRESSGVIPTAAAGCGAPNRGSDLDYVQTYLRRRAENTDFADGPKTLANYVDMAATDDQAAVVVGRVTGGGRGRAFTADGHPADPEDADWKPVHVRVEVDEALERDQAGRTVDVGFVVDPDMDERRVVSGLENLGRAVFVLHKSAVFDYDPSRFGVGREGSLVATVDDGQLRMPFVNDETEAAVIPQPATLDALRHATSG